MATATPLQEAHSRDSKLQSELSARDAFNHPKNAYLSREDMARIKQMQEKIDSINRRYDRLEAMGNEMRGILQDVESGILSATAEMKAYNENRRACLQPTKTDETPKRIKAKRNKEGVVEVWLEVDSGVWTSAVPGWNEDFAETTEKPIPSPYIFEIVREPLLLKLFDTRRGRNMWLPSILERLRQKYNEAEECFYYIFWNGTKIYFTKYTYGQVLWYHPKSGTCGAVEFDDIARYCKFLLPLLQHYMLRALKLDSWV
ncbi:hypothetical protein BT69DRAFT_839924 [Atractiella rhizophila]|nr:hypothetical protein BT69DRAFT_839924 [Atractiella rhizophila]